MSLAALEADRSLHEQLAGVVDQRRRELEQLQLDHSRGSELDILSRMKQLIWGLL